MGEDAELIASAMDENIHISHVHTMEGAVVQAFDMAKPGDLVLLSPACASFDMFDGYEDRGNHFVQSVQELLR